MAQIPPNVPPTMQVPDSAMSVGAGGPTASLPKKGKKRQDVATQNLSPEQMTQLQLEEAIKESQNPAMRLKKLRFPLSIKSCLLNLLLLIVLSVTIAFILAAYLPSVKVDKFDFGVLFTNMFEEFGFFRFFEMIGDWFASLGGG